MFGKRVLGGVLDVAPAAGEGEVVHGKGPRPRQRHCHDVETARLVVPPTGSSGLPWCLFPQVMLPRQLASTSCYAHA
eukprot:6869610-Pyramimonas_sp.AAC.1